MTPSEVAARDRYWRPSSKVGVLGSSAMPPTHPNVGMPAPAALVIEWADILKSMCLSKNFRNEQK